jgi:diguanylate cyclase (GGDEF)-like protein/PAS domain S-box-containing protein
MVSSAVRQGTELDFEDSETDRRWQMALDCTGQGVWEIRREPDSRYVSPSWYRMRGLDPNDPSTSEFENWILRVHEEDRAYILQDIATVKSDEERTVRREYRERHADGHWIWILSHGRATEWNKHGRPIRFVGTDTDITLLKKSESDLRRLSHRHDLAVSTAKLGFWEYDLVKCVPHWDQNTKELFGVEGMDNPLPHDIWDQRIHPDDRPRALATAGSAVQTRSSYAMDYRIVLPSDEIRHVRCRAVFYDDAVSGPRLVGVNWDVTSDHKYAEQLRSAKELAEKRSLEIENAHWSIKHNALHDALTGLPNRRQLDLLLDSLETPNASQDRIAVMHVDLDRFKQINDTQGHRAGDAILNHVATVLKAGIGNSGLVCRSGGDEFVIVATRAADDQHLANLAARLLRELSAPVLYNGHESYFGASIGIATSEHGQISGRQLLVNADLALYRAKSDGRNRFCFFSAEMQQQAIETKKCADELKRGLERGEFFPVYQLQFDARNQDVIGVEALVRWRHPTRGVLPPEEFLNVAEDINAAARIDEIILEQALVDFAAWRHAGISVPHLSVNVSVRRLGDVHLIEGLRKLDVPSDCLSFELLESIYLDNHDDVVVRNLSALKAMGIGIEIDDFGTGHASIACLLNLRPKRLKIDRQLVKPIVASIETRRLLASIVDIGEALGIEVLAEGVETLEHARILAEIDCFCLQGFAFATAMTAHDVAEFVASNRWKKAG